MREIKFRFYRKPHQYEIHHWEKKVETTIKAKQPGEMVYWPGSISLIAYLDNNDTVMQFTGVKDKNGKDIYEGDILKFNGLDLMVVEYQTKDAEYNYGWNFGRDDGEIIGNIYENKELLK